MAYSVSLETLIVKPLVHHMQGCTELQRPSMTGSAEIVPFLSTDYLQTCALDIALAIGYFRVAPLLAL
jgi:hypothetical protein